ncbi:MAG: hypothetical protein BWY63_02385 [Chloroflexi bacterium ADurb.Bin360]|nr:MAG: hypothetical protein BWY63_02385 [Chloroflexi bacterium ADurb.Bin360]
MSFSICQSFVSTQFPNVKIKRESYQVNPSNSKTEEVLVS